jgi:DNA-binding FadR family transcriptional regulator
MFIGTASRLVLREGLERLKYEGVVKELQEALEKIKLPCP